MIKDFLDLRNRIQRGKFRLDMMPSVWRSHYAGSEEMNAQNVLTIVKDREMKAYCVYSAIADEGTKVYKILEICADGSEAFNELIDCIVRNGMKDQVDFIFLRESDESHGAALRIKGFMSFVDSVISIVLLDPKKLLSSISEEVHEGKTFRLNIHDFEPVTVKVGKEKIMILESEKSECSMSTDAKTFLRLFFGKTSFLKEFLKRNVKVSVFDLLITKRFFKLIKTEKWYIPSGDWC